jgi:CheY-like chemotaxis protein
VCPFCHATLRKNCGGCGVELKKKWTMCPFCGTKVAPSAAAPLVLTESPPRGRELGTFEAPRILVVDDDRVTLEVARLALIRSRPSLQVETALSGEEALSKVTASRPHLILLDLSMPEMDGYEVCRRLRTNLKTALIPVMMITSRDDPESKQLGFLAGTDDYVVKPFESGELLARVHRLLQRTYGWSSPSIEEAA